MVDPPRARQKIFRRMSVIHLSGSTPSHYMVLLVLSLRMSVELPDPESSAFNATLVEMAGALMQQEAQCQPTSLKFRTISCGTLMYLGMIQAVRTRCGTIMFPAFTSIIWGTLDGRTYTNLVRRGTETAMPGAATPSPVTLELEPTLGDLPLEQDLFATGSNKIHQEAHERKRSR